MKYTVNNNSIILMADFPLGTTQDVEVKVGRKTMMLDVTKDAANCCIEIYPKRNADRQKYSKYGAGYCRFTVCKGACLDRDFFDNAEEIARAQAVVELYRSKYILA